MSFFCKDCGYKAAKRFNAGKCPACDGFNIAKEGEALNYVPERRRTLIGSVVMVLLWSALLYGLWDQYVAEKIFPPAIENQDSPENEVEASSESASDPYDIGL